MQFLKKTGGKCLDCMQSFYEEVKLRAQRNREQRNATSNSTNNANSYNLNNRQTRQPRNKETNNETMTFTCSQCQKNVHKSRRCLQNDYCLECDYKSDITCTKCAQTLPSGQYDGKLLNSHKMNNRTKLVCLYCK